MKKIIIVIIVTLIVLAVGTVIFNFWANSQFAKAPLVYINDKYNFQITLLDNWKNYTLQDATWQGNSVDNFDQKYSGPEIVIKNPQSTSQQAYQDIPIMVFTPEQWQLVVQERIAVSAAPIGPAQVGQNTKYVFATPPRWYGFTDALGWQEAVDAVKTFKAF